MERTAASSNQAADLTFMMLIAGSGGIEYVAGFVYTKAEAGQALGLSVRTIDNLIAAKEIRSRRVRGRVLIPADSLHTLLRSDHRTLLAAA